MSFLLHWICQLTAPFFSCFCLASNGLSLQILLGGKMSAVLENESPFPCCSLPLPPAEIQDSMHIKAANKRRGACCQVVLLMARTGLIATRCIRQLPWKQQMLSARRPSTSKKIHHFICSYRMLQMTPPVREIALGIPTKTRTLSPSCPNHGCVLLIRVHMTDTPSNSKS